MSPTAASRLALRLRTGGRGQKLLPAVLAAKVERLSIAFSVESGDFVHVHAADGVAGHVSSVSIGWFSGVATAIQPGTRLLIRVCPESFYGGQHSPGRWTSPFGPGGLIAPWFWQAVVQAFSDLCRDPFWFLGILVSWLVVLAVMPR